MAFQQACKVWRSGRDTALEAIQHIGLKPNTFYTLVGRKFYKEEDKRWRYIHYIVKCAISFQKNFIRNMFYSETR